MSGSDVIPDGLLEPVSCRKRRWMVARAAMMKGRMKWKVKNRVRVALSTENPPQIHWTRSDPIYGIADRRFVITVAPQNDIWPHGRTYPMNAVAMVVSSRIVPTPQVFRKRKDP